MVQVTYRKTSKQWVVAEHTGQSSQLFPVATGRNTQFLATVARSGLNMKDESAHLLFPAAARA